MKPDEIILRANTLADSIELNKDKITKTLLDYESFETVSHELSRSVDCLRHIDIESENLTVRKVGAICTFLPLNLPLYSLILFAFIPKFMTNRVFIRPPETAREIITSLYKILNNDGTFQNISIVNVSRSLFLEGYASTADIVIFTGKYENAQIVRNSCSNALFIYNGAGINPIIVSESANLDLATTKTIAMRIFNSGQDCAGPDAILVNRGVHRLFLKNLMEKLNQVRIGSYHDRQVRVGKLGDYRQISAISKFFDKFREQIQYGGVINYKERIVFPTVVFTELKHAVGYQEFFGPIFHVIAYRNEIELEKYFCDQHYQNHAMYIQLFGRLKYVEKMRHSIILENKIVNDVERGNYPYGGYGSKASFVSYNGDVFCRPILISREIAEYFRVFRGEQTTHATTF